MSNVVRIRHTSGAKQCLEEAHRVMGLANQLSNQLERIFNQWTKVRISDDEVKKLSNWHYAQIRKALSLSKTAKRTNSVTGYYQNVRKYKDEEAKLQSIVLGGTAQTKPQKAFELCTAFAKNGAD